MDKIKVINEIINNYFKQNKDIDIINAKDLMPDFIRLKVFATDQKNGLPIRKILRKLDKDNQLHLIPHVYFERKSKNTNWFFRRATDSVIEIKSIERTRSNKSEKTTGKTSKNRDEDYILDLCDRILKKKGLRQYRFDFLTGDSGRKLPVDVYYENLSLVIEYREYQHTNTVDFFDKPDKQTVSGVCRGEQRKIYDQRRRNILPENNVRLLEIDYSEFDNTKNKKILRNEENDLKYIQKRLTKYIKTIDK
ncbi:hypothetical protein EV144_1011430 [Flavobacterium sp. 270]|uniref:hypothetical protein n=1 Tax=Flavobacterium sp. 270 TaxID=2512114 RepID=UPI0010F0CE1C|nr:hypothetical protein [Flavobacterium sp. 270]TDW52737.1 hypothetical protein EV144_1011430 [Flavobacterium sp. 270]